jgi:glycine cleavage system H protein
VRQKGFREVTPDDLKYTEEHEWVAAPTAGVVRIGITDYAQEQLGDVVYVQLPEVGKTVGASDALGEVESTKSVSEIFAPVSGEVTAVNAELEDNPELINSEPYGGGWLVEIKLGDESELDGLLDADDYRKTTEAD